MKGISEQVMVFVIAVIIISIILVIGLVFLSGGKISGEQGLLSGSVQQCCAEYKACIARGGTDSTCANINCRYPNGTIVSATKLIQSYYGLSASPSQFC